MIISRLIKEKKIKIFFVMIFISVFCFIEYIYLGCFENSIKKPIVFDFTQIKKLNYRKRKLNKIVYNITLVSAYFKIPSKHLTSEYDQWISNFLQIDSPMIFFIDNAYYREIIVKRPVKYINKTIWIKINITDFYSYKKYFKEFNQAYKIDIEKNIHTVPLYLVWAEKINFLKIAVVENYFQSKCFYWIDSGCFRNNESVLNYIKDWPSPKKCFEDGRVIMNEVLKHSNDFYSNYTKFDITTHKYMQKSISVDGSCFGGQKNYIFKFHDLYYDVLNKFIEHGIFIGKDQNIFAYIAYNNPTIVKLVYLKKFFGLRKYLLKSDNNLI